MADRRFSATALDRPYSASNAVTLMLTELESFAASDNPEVQYVSVDCGDKPLKDVLDWIRDNAKDLEACAYGFFNIKLDDALIAAGLGSVSMLGGAIAQACREVRSTAPAAPFFSQLRNEFSSLKSKAKAGAEFTVQVLDAGGKTVIEFQNVSRDELPKKITRKKSSK